MSKNINKNIRKSAVISFMGLLDYSIIRLFICFCAYIMLPHLAFAAPVFESGSTPAIQESFSVSPIITDIYLTPGQETHYQLRVTNLTDIPLGIHASLSPFTSDPQAKNVKTSLISWTTLSDQDIVIGPQNMQDITVTITPPKDTENGGYYGMLLLTSFSSTQPAPNHPVILSQIGVLIFGTVGKLNFDDLAKKVAITQFRQISFFSGNRPTIIFTVQNNYFTHFTAKPTLILSPLLFGHQEVLTLDEKHILPGTTRSWTISPSLSAWQVMYRAHLTISVGNGKRITQDHWIIGMSAHYVLIILMLLAILLIYIRNRKNMHKAVRILFKGD